MKTIGILLGSLAGAGAEKSLLTLAIALANKGHLVHLVLLKDVFDFPAPERIRLIVLNPNNPAKQLNQLTSSIDFDLFICSRIELYAQINCPNTWGFVCITPTAWIDTPKWRWFKYRKARKKLHKYLDKNLVAVSQGIAADLVHNIGVNPNRVRVIYDAYDFAEIHNMARQPAPLPSRPYIICVGALKKRKGQEYLLRATAQLANKQIQLLLIGRGDAQARLERLARHLGIADRVRFIGWAANPYPYMANACLCVLASFAEGLPRAIVEALLLKTPVVSTECLSGPSELLTGALADFLVPVKEVQPMVKAIDRALASYPAIEVDLSRFNSEQAASNYEGLI